MAPKMVIFSIKTTVLGVIFVHFGLKLGNYQVLCQIGPKIAKIAQNDQKMVIFRRF